VIFKLKTQENVIKTTVSNSSALLIAVCHSCLKNELHNDAAPLHSHIMILVGSLRLSAAHETGEFMTWLAIWFYR